MQEEGAWEWALGIPDCGIYGFQALARGEVPVLKD